jgi:phospholipid/cholesterol/gamma-HCH transport system substrate-binding protein
MSRNVIETVMGAVVLVVAAIFLAFAYRMADVGAVKGYEVWAGFSATGGLQTGADVRISGVKVGSVTNQSLDPSTFLAVVRMSIDPSIKLTADTTAAIKSESLLGGRYVLLSPGGDPDEIKPGGRIQFVQNPVDLEDLIGRFMFSSQGQSSSAATPPATGATQTP